MFALAGIFLAGARNCVFFLTSVKTLGNSHTSAMDFVCGVLCRKIPDQPSFDFLAGCEKNTASVNGPTCHGVHTWEKKNSSNFSHTKVSSVNTLAGSHTNATTFVCVIICGKFAVQ